MSLHPSASADVPSLQSLLQVLSPCCRELMQLEGWQSLARHARQQDELHHCPFCNQWLAKLQYLTRHVKAQHPECQPVLDKLQQRLRDRRATVHSPCQWCHAHFQAKHVSKLKRVSYYCTTLIRTGILTVLQTLQVPEIGHGPSPNGGAAETHREPRRLTWRDSERDPGMEFGSNELKRGTRSETMDGAPIGGQT